MDPFSITSGVLAILVRTISAIQPCQIFATKYRIADLSTGAVRTEFSSIRVAHLQIQNVIPCLKLHAVGALKERVCASPKRGKWCSDIPQLQSRGRGRGQGHNVGDGDGDDYVLEEYKAVLGACSLKFALLNERIEALGLDKLDARNESEERAKLRFLWSEGQMDVIRQNIRGQAIAVSLLLSAFQSDMDTKSYQILKSQQAKSVLVVVSKEARALREGSIAPKTKASDMVINSQAYQRVSQRQQSNLQAQAVQEKEEERKIHSRGAQAASSAERSSQFAGRPSGFAGSLPSQSQYIQSSKHPIFGSPPIQNLTPIFNFTDAGISHQEYRTKFKQPKSLSILFSEEVLSNSQLLFSTIHISGELLAKLRPRLLLSIRRISGEVL